MRGERSELITQTLKCVQVDVAVTHQNSNLPTAISLFNRTTPANSPAPRCRKTKIRNPNIEIRNKRETANSKNENPKQGSFRNLSFLVILDLFRISDFEFVFFRCLPTWVLLQAARVRRRGRRRGYLPG